MITPFKYLHLYSVLQAVAIELRTQATLNGVSEYQISYADNGNIITKTDVGDYLYDAGSKPHAMRGIEGVAGYGVTDDPQALSYTYFNKVSSVEQTAQRYNIYYGLDHQRRKSEKLRDGHLYHTRYYMGSCEIDIDSLGQECISEYIYTPSGLTAIYREGQLLYVHSDHLGSIAAVSDSMSRVVCTYAYTPWGGRLLLSGESVTDRGYTLHEHIDPFGLIDMSGRMYDPVLARFLSPDPYVQAPDFTQSFNRYAYCWNNPFSYTDPSGEYVMATAGIFIGAAINFMAQAISGNLHSGQDILLSFAIGGIAGGLAGLAAIGVSAAVGSIGALAGMATGAAAGAVSGMVLGSGNAWAGGADFGSGLLQGLMGAGIGAVTGAAIGGITGGINAATDLRDFWSGYPLVQEDLLGASIADITPAQLDKGMEFSSEHVRSKLSNRYRTIRIPKNLNAIYADGSVPNQLKGSYSYDAVKGCYVNKEGMGVRAFAYNRNVYLSKAAMTSDVQLYLTIQHEFAHVNYSSYKGIINPKIAHASIYDWQSNQAAEWGLYSLSNQYRSGAYYSGQVMYSGEYDHYIRKFGMFIIQSLP